MIRNYLACICGRRFSLKCVLVLALIGLAVAPANRAAAQEYDEAEAAQIRSLLDAQVACWNKSDLEGFMQTYWNSEELTFSSGGQTTRGWQATLDRYRRRYQADGAEMGQLSFADLEISQLSSDVALVLGKWKLKMEQDQPAGNFSLVLKKMDGDWKIIHDHSSALEDR